MELADIYSKLPLGFELNRGQTDKEVYFLSRERGYTVFLTSREAVFSFRDRPLAESPSSPRANAKASHSSPSGDIFPEVVRMKLAGSNARPKVSGVERLPGTANYFIGNDPRRWRTRIPTFAQVRYEDVYPGIDLVYYGNPHQLEYDFEVAPGADPHVIRLSLRGADGMKLDARGDIVLSERGREFRLEKPVVYQEQSSIVSRELSVSKSGPQGTTDNGPRTAGPDNHQSLIADRKYLDGRYVLLADNRIGFQVSSYDRSRPLIIDPALSYSTFLGGSNFDQGSNITVDAAGEAYVTGFTSSSNFPVTSGAYQTAYGGATDAFITKFSASGSTVVYSTFLGGSFGDQGRGIAVDSSGNANIAGETFSSNFPTTVGALQTSYGGDGDAFVAILSADGSSLLYSSYLGGSGLDEALGIALDSRNDIYLTGKTFSTNFPIMSPLQPTNQGVQNAFVTELEANGSLIYSTYLGGSAYDQANAIAVDAFGNAYVTGYTTSTNFPTASALQATCTSCSSNIADAFVAEINANGTGLVYSTFLGGSADDQGMGIAVDADRNAYVAGTTFSTDFPTTPGALETSLLGSASAFVTRIGPNGASLGYSTYVGGNGYTYGQSMAVLNENAYIAGVTNSSNLPMVNAVQSQRQGPVNTFISELNPQGSGLAFSTYLGGNTWDSADGVAVDTSGNIYITGGTQSSNYPTHSPFQVNYGGGGSDAVVSMINVPPPVTLSPTSVTFGNQTVGASSAAKVVTLVNSSGTTLTLTSIAMTGTDLGDFAQTNNCGSTVASGASCTINVTFTPTATGTRNAALTVTDSASNSPQTAGLTGSGVASSASLSPTSLTFSSQIVGTISSAQAVTLSNSSSAALSISSIAVTGTNSGDFAQSNNCGASLAANSSCTINVTFTPTATGTRTASLTVTDNAPNSPQTASLSGTGTTSSASPPSFVQVQNNIDTSGTAYTFFSVNITTSPGSLLVAFVRESSNGTDNFTVTDSAGQTWTLTSSSYLNESDSGPRVGMFYMANSAAVTSVTVHYTTLGGVIKPGIMVMEISGAVTSGAADEFANHASLAPVTTSTSGSLTTSNANDILIFATDAAGDQTGWTAGANYTIPNNGVKIGASGSNVRMAMQYEAVNSLESGATTSMTYSSSAWNGNIFAAFKGAASTSGTPGASLSPSSLTFTSQNVGTTSAAQAVTLSNSGSAGLSISSIAVTGTNSGDFAQSNNCGTSLAAGSKCTINVTFTPTATGTRTATLAVTDNASGSPQTASLTGTGTSGTGSVPAVVQVQNNVDTSGSAFTTFSVPITTTAGDLLVAFVRESSNGTDNFTVTDSAGQTWTLTSSGYLNESDSGPRVGMFYIANSAAVTSVTVHYTTLGGVIKPGIMVMEISGAVTSGAADEFANHASLASVTTSTSGSLTTSNANDILIFATDAAGDQTGWTAGAGYAIPNNKLMVGPSGSNVRMAMQYKVVSSVQSGVMTSMTYLNSDWNGNIFAAFK